MKKKFITLLISIYFFSIHLTAQMTYTVTSLEDDGTDGTLRYGIEQTTATLIHIDPNLARDSIILQNEIRIERSIDIRGFTDENDQPDITIRVPVTYNESVSGGGIASDFRLFHINNNTTDITVNISDIILKGGAVQDRQPIAINEGSSEPDNHGGVIMVRTSRNTLNLNNVLVGEARGDHGGGVFSQGPMTISNSTFQYNMAYDGGGLYDNSATININNTNFRYNNVINEGGGVYEAYSADCTMNEVYFENNNAGTDGAGIHTGNSSSATLIKCSFLRNKATASGGAIHNANVCTMNIDNSTFAGNSAQNGGAVYNANDATMNIINSTFAGNSANDPDPDNSNGGALYTTSTVPTTVINCVIAGNYVGSTPIDATTEEIYVGVTEGTQDPSVLNMAYSIYGVTESVGEINPVECTTYEDITKLDEFLKEVYNARWVLDNTNRYILVDIDSGESIYEEEGKVLRISRFGKAAYNGTLVGKIGDDYYFRDFADFDRDENKDGKDDGDEKPVDLWMSFTTDLTTPFKSGTPNTFGLEVLGTATVYTTGENVGTNGMYMSRVYTHFAYNAGAYALDIEDPSLVVTTNIDNINPFDFLITLREAAEAYSLDTNLGYTVTFDTGIFSGSGVTDTIKVNDKPITIDHTLSIIGNGTEKVIISGQNKTDMLWILAPTGEIYISDLTLRDGYGDTGGAMYSMANKSFVLYNLKFLNNYGTMGGALYHYDTNPTRFSNLLFANNTAEFTGGAIWLEDSYEGTTITNCTFADNTIIDEWGPGTAIHTINSSPLIVNCIMWGNENETYNPDVTENTFTINNGIYRIYNSLVEDQTTEDSDGNIAGTTDPLFIDPSADDYRLDRCSPLANRGDDYYLTDELNITEDLGGETRLISTHVDPGAYEIQLPAPAIAIWSPENNVSGTELEKQDWNNPLNWEPYGIPYDCSDVYIPGLSTNGSDQYFPDLTNASGIVNNIYFLHGGELAHPQNLTYEQAHVQLNFGLGNRAQSKSTDIEDKLAYSAQYAAGSLERNKWNMLSAPLKNMVSGDFSFGGYPLSFLRKFDVTSPSAGEYQSGQWTTLFASNVEEFAPGEGFILWMNEYRDQDLYRESGSGIDEFISSGNREYGIDRINGIVEFPYYQDSLSIDAHRSQIVNGNSNQFYYVWTTQDVNFMQVSNQYDTYDRGENNSAYRFITENYNNGWQFPTITTREIENTNNSAIEALVGNPYVSTINFINFYNDNSSYIQPQYRLWTGDGFVTLKVQGNTVISNPDGALDQYIAPMQSFFILTQENSGTFDLTYNVENISVPKPVTSTSSLKSDHSDTEKNILRIKAENDLYSSETLIGKLENAHDEYIAGEDVYKLFSQKGNVPEIYTLTDEFALEMNFVRNNNISIPLGIKTQRMGSTSFTFKGMDNYDADKINFVDLELNQTIDITGLNTFKYDFDNSIQGIQNGRFLINFVTSQPTGLEDISGNSVHAYRNEKGIYIISSEGNRIKELTIYNIEGSTLYNTSNINTSWYNVQLNQDIPVMIVKILTEQGIKTFKLIKQ